MNQLKVFTLKEANDILPQLTPKLQELRATREVILKLEVEIDTLELLADKNSNESLPPSVSKKVEEYTKLVNRFYALIDEIHETGCILKDVDIGLVDFYTLYKGKVVYLCWRLGEPEVGFWHDIGSGYSNRQKLEDPDEHR
jgi:hypothetical protein